ncbi:hypothetical protein GGI15_003378 [Coemansia interrupta]|uniref:Uncharacterized protein n=1 Tax=Coemansia interrupta TaxID=1126814 RepID=A0A9W8HCV9_9FUNG|nr:hypothetical protein GGI15_003378 [Coemansia interrupta]
MQLKVLSLLFLASCAAATWTSAQKIGIYSMIQKLAQTQPSSMDERIVYGKMAIFFNDWLTSAQLSNNIDTSQYRTGLFSLLAHLNDVKQDASKDPAGSDNMDYLILRIKQSYGESLFRFFGH